MWKEILSVWTSLLLCLPLAHSSIINEVESDELLFVHILFRHGDRNILNTYPNDPWKNEQKYWPEGFGELTNLGRQQHQNLGSFLRRRYFDLIPNNGSYHHNNIYVRSTDYGRSLMSAAHNLAGFFPPQNHQIWNESLHWQAIPIHTFPSELDHILDLKGPCPLYLHSFAEFLQSPKMQLIFKNNQPLFEYLQLHTGIKKFTFKNILYLYDTLSVEKLRQFQLPTWSNEVLVPLKKFTCEMLTWGTSSKNLARLRIGFLIREMLDRFTMKRDKTLSPDRSLWIYSAHDMTMANLLNSLGLFKEPHIPEHASCLLFELHKSNGTYHVEILYKRKTEEEFLEPQFIPNCGWKCPLTKFYDIYQDIIPTEDFETECRLPKVFGKSANSSPPITSGTKTLLTIWMTIYWAILFIFSSVS